MCCARKVGFKNFGFIYYIFISSLYLKKIIILLVCLFFLSKHQNDKQIQRELLKTVFHVKLKN